MSDTAKNIEDPKRSGKWRYLAERIVNKPGKPRQYTLAQLKEEFVKYVDYYSDAKTTYQMKSRQKKGGSGNEVQAERTERVSPMTEWSFCLWIGKDRSWLATTILDIQDRDNPTPEDVEYLEFLQALRTFLNSQLLEGAILGEYTPVIISSLLGLKKNVDITTDNKPLDAPVINIVPDTTTREQYAQQNVPDDEDAETEEDAD